MTELETLEQLEAFLKENPGAVILKHSTSCLVSINAYREFSSFSSKNPSIPTAVISVIEARAVSDRLAEDTGVTHESPQVIFFRNGECYQNISHFQVTRKNIEVTLK
jgi:bacillithiol system protein YtxJ